MKLVEDWKAILQKAWSVKFNIAAAFFGALEIAIVLIKPAAVPNGIFVTIAFFISLATPYFRVQAQKELVTVAIPENAQ